MPDLVKTYTVKVKSNQEMVYRTLRDEILRMDLKPGTTITTQEMAERFGVSSTPVREAFIRLQNESLLTISPQKATRVSYINLDRTHQERFIREAMEVDNLSLFIARADEENMTYMADSVVQQRKAMAEKRYHDFIEIDNDFHQYPFQITGQKLGLRIIRQMNGHYERIRLLTAWDEIIALNAIEEHDMLVETMRDKNVVEASKLLRRHLQVLSEEENRLRDHWPDFFDHD